MTDRHLLIARWGVYPLWLVLTVTVFFRAPIPIDETRYLSVAWEMWLRGDFLVPHLNGASYSHKPPLLFWLMQAGWAVFGVNDWWPRLVGPLAALANLVLLRRLAQALWPERRGVAGLAPWILISTLLWTLFASSTMFDVLLTDCVLLVLLGVLAAARGGGWQAWGLAGLGLGLGILAKGPVVLLHVLPTALAVGFWADRRRPTYSNWSLGVIGAVLVGAALALSWAIPAAQAGGEEYGRAILWHQTADRTVGTKIHTRSPFWYLLFLPLFLLPWGYAPRFWRNLRAMRLGEDAGARFCLVWFGATFVVFSAVPSKQIHYLLPAMPAFALFAARVWDESAQMRSRYSEMVIPGLLLAVGVFLLAMPTIPGLAKWSWVRALQSDWGASVLLIAGGLGFWTWRRQRLSPFAASAALVLSVAVGFVCFFRDNGAAYDLSPTARQVKNFADTGVPCAYVGNYQGQLNFLGKLTRPLPVIPAERAKAWAAEHPDGYLVSLENQPPGGEFLVQGHREYWLVVRRADRAGEIKAL
ncbi:ArnT family glycosyltransferase [Methylomonas sp. MED-D]|uniref:ArnT family glycosyltransferase n=1 Tax=unclassified Methylomonas TaxID=2608980 RepID=UPI0028A445A8|nr:glycosyltransferase family 39 protein [Methylomonas sp. MV1]MDT4330926.1 glycosyltransferase family 39 protein [Methylomonas sp. MV1]